jgi:hypothetical protein
MVASKSVVLYPIGVASLLFVLRVSIVQWLRLEENPQIVPSIVMNGVKPTTTEEPVHTRPSNCGHGMNDQES